MTLPVRSISRVLSETPEEPDWIVHGLIVGGTVTLIAGLPKVGKSSLVTGMIAKVAHGESFAGLPTRKARTLILSEESALAFREKAMCFDLDDDGAAVLFWSDVYAEPWGGVLQRAAEYAEEHGFDVLVVGTWNRWSGLTGDSENNAGAVLSSLAPVNIAAAERNLAVVLIGHARKTPGDMGMDVRGSNAIVGSVDIVVKYEPAPRGSNSTRLLHTWSRFPSAPELQLDLDDVGFHASAVEDRAEHERATILATLAGVAGALSADEIGEQTGLEPATVRRRLADCHEIVKHGSGRKGDPYRYAIAQPTLLEEAA